jgi:hypothetical protein
MVAPDESKIAYIGLENGIIIILTPFGTVAECLAIIINNKDNYRTLPLPDGNKVRQA